MKVKVPDSWDEVTVGQYQEIKQTDSDLEIVSILLDEDPEIIKKFDAHSMERILNCLGWIKSMPQENIYKAFIEVDGVEYRLVEDLSKFSLGEWIDMDEYLKDFTGNLHYILAMLYRNEPYDTEVYKKNGELFAEKVMIGDIYGSFVFFSIVATKCMLTTRVYLMTQALMKGNLQKREKNGWMKKWPLRSGTGTTTLTS